MHSVADSIEDFDEKLKFILKNIVDELGRVVIPIEIRNKFDIVEKDPLEVYVDGNAIILKNMSLIACFVGKAKN